MTAPPDPFDLVVAAPARRAIDRIPSKVAIAVVDFLLGPLATNPHRAGKPLQRRLAGLHAARVGAYRVIHQIDDPTHTVTVLTIDHRADVYR